MMKAIALACGLAVAASFELHAQIIDTFDDTLAWQAAPASGVELRLSADAGRSGKALRADFDFHGGGGWAAFRRAVSLQLPENYEISFWLKADAPNNTLEFKLVDPSGENVWWVNRPEFEFRGPWRRITFRKRHVKFAWGPAGGGDIRTVGAIEFAITAGSGGKGTVWIDDLSIAPREPVRPYDATPVVTNAANAHTIDFTRNREYGGIIVGWRKPGADRRYDVQVSTDGNVWQSIRSVRNGRRSRDYLQLPETESRYLRLALRENASTQDIAGVRIMPVEWGSSRNALFDSISAGVPRGSYPRYFTAEQSYWTVVGENGGMREALINEDGAVEVDKRAFSLEPFVRLDGSLLTWSNVQLSQSLGEGSLPIPTVKWSAPGFSLEVTSWVEARTLWLRYRVGHAAQSAEPVLYIAIRPFQVNPSTQFLNTPGGATRITSIERNADGSIAVDGRRVVPVTPAAGFGAATFDEGDVIDYLRRGVMPAATAVSDSQAAASAVLAYPLTRASTRIQEIYIAVPRDSSSDVSDAAASLRAATAKWRSDLSGFTIDIPEPRLAASVRSNLAYILVNRDSAAIQPGSRSYERSWIRDGSLTSAALLRLGHSAEVRQFIEWYAPYQYADGKVPCCVDQHGAGPVPENDSHGELIYLITEYFRYARDTTFVRRMYGHVEHAVAYMDSLRNSRRTAEFRGTPFFGLLPQSISHEGYSAKPMHSYWDDFFALKGFKDAAWLAHVLRDSAHARTWAAMRDQFQAELMRSLQLAMQQHHIDYLPGAAELGDFDATSTTVAVNPAEAQRELPASALQNTFDQYWQNFVARRDRNRWEAYTPYEWRVAGTFVRLGQRDRAHALADWFLQHQRPAGWLQWAEVVYRDARAPHFIGDMPHTWVGSDFIRSVLDMFAYEDHNALVIGAGILPEWVRSQTGVRIAGLHTPYGVLAYGMKADANQVVVTFDSPPPVPPAGFVIRSPLDAPIREARADGARIYTAPDQVALRRLPHRLVLSY